VAARPAASMSVKPVPFHGGRVGMIKDEFSRLPSASRRHQLRKVKRGLCAVCTRTRVNATYCAYHAAKARERIKRRSILPLRAPKIIVDNLKTGEEEKWET